MTESPVGLMRSMLRIRMIEQAIADRYGEQEMRCPTHLSIGQEAVPVAVSAALRQNDTVVSAHRSHAHYLARGGDLRRMVAELYGRSTGCAGGRGGSMHLIDDENGFTAAVPIVGSSIAIATGLAFGKKLQGNDSVTVVYLGDAATEEGIFSECLNFAALHRLRILFVCENNLFSVYTHIAARQAPGRSLCGLAAAHGVDALSLDSRDVVILAKDVAGAVGTLRDEGRPALVVAETFRTLEHCGPNSDDHLGYRDPELVADWSRSDPLVLLRGQLTQEGSLGSQDEACWKDEIDAEIEEAFSFAKASPFPTIDELLEFTHAS